MDASQISDLIVSVFPYVITLTALIVPALQTRAARRQEQKRQKFDFETARRAQCIESFLAVAANSLYLGVQFQDMQNLWNAYGQVSFYVNEKTRAIMREFCQLATKDQQKAKIDLYNQIVQALQSEPPRNVR